MTLIEIYARVRIVRAILNKRLSTSFRQPLTDIEIPFSR